MAKLSKATRFNIKKVAIYLLILGILAVIVYITAWDRPVFTGNVITAYEMAQICKDDVGFLMKEIDYYATGNGVLVFNVHYDIDEGSELIRHSVWPARIYIHRNDAWYELERRQSVAGSSPNIRIDPYMHNDGQITGILDFQSKYGTFRRGDFKLVLDWEITLDDFRVLRTTTVLSFRL